MDIKAVAISARSLDAIEGHHRIAISIHAFDDAAHMQRAVDGDPANGLAITLVVKEIAEIGEAMTKAFRELMNT